MSTGQNGETAGKRAKLVSESVGRDRSGDEILTVTRRLQLDSKNAVRVNLSEQIRPIMGWEAGDDVLLRLRTDPLRVVIEPSGVEHE